MRFCDLGALQVEVGGRQVPVQGRLAAVLATLLLHVEQRVPVDLLLDAVWGDRVTDRSVNTLETHVWRLRRLLEPDRVPGRASIVLLKDSGGYRLVSVREQVDSAYFEQLSLDALDLITTSQPDRALRAVEDALRLWRGAPWEVLVDRSWARGPIARLTETRAHLQERRVAALIQLGRTEQAVADLEPLLVERPLHERLWAQRMLALYLLGRTEDALQAYRAVRLTLLDELGLEPGRELVELEQRILRDDESLQVAAPAVRVATVRPVTVRLPRPRALLGRERELAGVAELLRSAPLVTVIGAAGCGKTALATAVAHAESSAYPDGVWFVDLSAADGDSEVAGLVAGALDLAVPHDEQATALASFAVDRQALVVLDNCEQVLGQVVSLVDDWARREPQVRLLATSREPLSVAGEAVFPLEPLPVLGPVAPQGPVVAQDEPAVQLFVVSARLGGELSAAELSAVRRICRAVDGLPLAIELAAALSLTYSLEEIADEVESDPGQLAAVGRGGARHHQTLTAAVERSYRLLGPEEQLLHRRLAVLPGEFGREVAEVVTGAGASLTSTLARLVHASLLARTRSDGRTRFFQLAPIRSHAMRALRAGSELDEAEALRDTWLSDLVERRPRLGRPEQAGWLAALRRDLPSVRASLRRQLQLDTGQAGVREASQLTAFWYYEDLLEEGVEWAELATARATQRDVTAVMARLALASTLAMRYRADRSRRLAEEALTGLMSTDAGLRLPGQGPLGLPVQVQLAEALVATSTAFSVTRDSGAMRQPLLLLDRAGLAADDLDLALTRDAAGCLLEVVEGPSQDTLDRAEAVYERAVAHGNSDAGWLSAGSVSAIALARRDARLGQTWSRRVLDQQGRSGARAMMAQVETLGDFLALDGELVAAVRIFSATHHQARRVGHPWPRNPMTTDLLADCQARLSTHDFDAAWAVGPTLKRDELMVVGAGQ